MRADELRAFLKKFDVSNSKIADLFLKKKLVVRNGNVFLVSEDMSEDVVFEDMLVFIRLKKFLPSSYLLEEIRKNTKNVIQVRGDKQALDFTYGKGLTFHQINANFNLESGKYYLVVHYDKPLGYVEIQNKKLRNVMNIGDYLRE